MSPRKGPLCTAELSWEQGMSWCLGSAACILKIKVPAEEFIQKPEYSITGTFSFIAKSQEI